MKGITCSARTPRAFTLVELLVVIGIIALLIGILLPVLSKAREQSRRTACLANLRTIGQAMFLYAAAHKDRLPNHNPVGMWQSEKTASTALTSFANGFVKQAAVFHCPSDPDPVPQQITNGFYFAEDSARTSYEFYSIWWPGDLGPTLTRLKGQAPLAWDMDGGTRRTPPDPNAPFIATENHGSAGGNVLYADGHADWQDAGSWDDESWPHPAQQFYSEPAPDTK
jgi:prepilin-type N-terminal cleavage/methylation domain-containing protein/prepilin-type processing-associated H-X9-DG protein